MGPCCPVLWLFWNLPPPQGRRLLRGWAACLTAGLPAVLGCSPEAPRRRVNPSWFQEKAGAAVESISLVLEDSGRRGVAWEQKGCHGLASRRSLPARGPTVPHSGVRGQRPGLRACTPLKSPVPGRGLHPRPCPRRSRGSWKGSGRRSGRRKRGGGCGRRASLRPQARQSGAPGPRWPCSTCAAGPRSTRTGGSRRRGRPGCCLTCMTAIRSLTSTSPPCWPTWRASGAAPAS